MPLFCCSGKNIKSKNKLDVFTILQDHKYKIFEIDSPQSTLMQSISVRIDQYLLNMQVLQNNIIFTYPQQKGKATQSKNAKYLDLTKENMTFSVLYDLDYKNKNRIPIGVKFIDYSQTVQLEQKIKKSKGNQKQDLMDQNTATTIKDDKINKKGQKVFNFDNLDEQYPSVSIYFQGNTQTFQEKFFEFLSIKIHQSDFRSIYKSVDVLGEGAQGTVFNVINRNTYKQYAVKVISKAELLNEPKSYEAIKLEIKLMKEVQSDLVIKIHQIFEDSEFIYLLIDLFNGGTLQRQIEQNRNFSIDEIQSIMKQLLLGITDLHSQKIMHRDIKPENILFKNKHSLQIAICDLGLATKWDIPQYLFQNVGTPGYVAPEIYHLQGQYDGICDIYSCGIILYQLLFHKLPFNENSTQQIYEDNYKSEINFEDLQVDNKAQKIGIELLKNMLQKDPQFRIQGRQCLKHKFFQLNNEDIYSDFSLKRNISVNQKLLQQKKQQLILENMQYEQNLKQSTILGSQKYQKYVNKLII